MRVLAAVIAVVSCALCGPAAAAPPALVPQPFVSGLSLPVEIVNAGDASGRLFVIEQGGRVRIVKDGVLLPTPFLDLSPAAGGRVHLGGESGLLGLAFHPRYATNGVFFVNYVRLVGGPLETETVLERYTRSAANPDVADPASRVELYVVPNMQNAHFGGKIAFGPDGYLYVSSGDGAGGGDPMRFAQSLTDLPGKMVRLDVDAATPYAIPPSNPLAAAADPAVRKEIWSRGFRNPWRFAFDRATGDLFIGDVAENRDEVSFEPRDEGGRNYGWSFWEGTVCFRPPDGCEVAVPDHTPPVIEIARVPGLPVALIGGYRYRGGAVPALFGYYLYGDFGSGRVWAARPIGESAWESTIVASVPGISAFGEDERGELYAASVQDGTIVRLTPAGPAFYDGKLKPRYRLHSPVTFDHLYTTDFHEYSVLPECCGWAPEGAIYLVFDQPGASVDGVAVVPNYRLYNRTSFQHHWTTSLHEYNVLGGLGWAQEGIDGYLLPAAATNTLPLYRLYVEAQGGLHLWTTDANERDVLVSRGWVDEGIAGYVLPVHP